ncbi:MAG: hypothetical protein JST80_04965 [Bdellovibrionales bacterium]|nr:hypothetical protein [Bdellovibrionales bacterium]
MKTLRGVEFLVFGTVLMIAGYLSLYQLHEYDVFWQLRVGRDLLLGQPVSPDRWSFTASGLDWVPSQGLTSIIFAAVQRLKSYEGLCELRSFLVMLWITVQALILRKTMKSQSTNLFVTRILTFAAFPLLIYLMCHWQLFLSVNFVTTILFSLLIAISVSELKNKTRIGLAMAVLVTWANAHSGTFLLGYGFFSVWVLTLSEIKPRHRALIAVLGLLCWLISPNGTNAVTAFLPFISHTETEAFGRNSFVFAYRGWAYTIAFGYIVFSAISLIWLMRERRMEKLPHPYRNRFFSGFLFLMLGYFTWKHVVMIPYLSVFLLPIAAIGLQNMTLALWSHAPMFKLVAIAIWAGLVGLTGVKWIPDDLFRLSSLHHGVGIDRTLLPQGAIEFLKNNPPVGYTLNHMDFGGMILDQIPGRLVSSDGRRLPFDSFVSERRDATATPELYTQFLEKYKITAVLEKIQFKRSLDLDHFYPQKDWAMVYFDNAGIVLFKRTPENLDAIKHFEYKKADRYRPIVAEEIQRCLQDDPENVYCRQISSEFNERAGNIAESINDLNRALRVEPWNKELLLKKERLLRATNDVDGVKQVRAWLDQL